MPTATLRVSHFFAWLLLVLLIGSANADAQILRRNPRVRPGGGLALPYQVGDGHGQTWLAYASTLQMQGNMPVYQQAGTVTVSGQQPNAQQSAHMDEKTNEVIVDPMQVGQFTFSRRLSFNTDDGYVRVIDLVKNSTGQDQPLTLQLTTYINFGVQSSQMVTDPKKNSVTLGWVATCNAGQAKAALDVYAGPGAKVNPTVEAQQGSNSVVCSFNCTVPAGKEVGIVHFHMVQTSQDQGMQWVKDMKPGKLFNDLPKEIRREIVNFRVNAGLIGDLEVLRGDAMDVVELRSGDKFNGTLNETAFKLDTFYGTIEIPVDKVVGIINAGQFKPRQLLVTADGQIFGGHLQKPTIDLELSSGQKTAIPLAQISRVGYRKRPDEKDDSADEQTLQPPYMLMASGDRVGVAMPTAPIAVVTRYGQLQLSPGVISSIIFNSDDSGVHTIELTGGSKFNGLCTATEFEVKLNTGGKDQVVKFPVAALNRIIFANRSDEKDETAPSLQLKKDDVLTGVLQGDLKLDTAFDTIALHAPEIRAITHNKDGPSDLSVTTWDGTIFSGQLQEQSVQCHLKSGIDVQIPIALIEAYSNPSATVPPMILDKIKSLVTDLNADDFKQRDDAEHQLVKLGAGVMPTLKSMRDAQTPEAQQRIDSVVKQLQK